MSTPIKSALSYVSELEGLRALMAWWVVLGHMALWSGYTASSSFTMPVFIQYLIKGSVPVEVFITISGFVIFFLLNKENSGSWKSYIAGRVFRLYPAYLLVFLLAIILLSVAESAQVTGTWHDPNFQQLVIKRTHSVYENLGLHSVLHLFMLHGLIPDQLLPYSGEAILGVAWSLSLEWQFYLVAPLLFYFSKKSPIALVVVCLIILGFKWLILKSSFTFSYGAFLPVKFEFFCLGISSFFVYKHVSENSTSWRGISLFLFLIFLAFIVMAFTGGMREHAYSVAIWLAVFMSTLFNLKKISWGKPLSNMLLLKPIAFLGRISYSTYLIHPLVIACFGNLIPFIFGNNLNNSHAFMLMIVTGCPTTLLLSWLIYKYIEVPGIRFGKKFAG